MGLAAGIAFAWWGERAHRARKSRFESREALGLSRWMTQFYPDRIEYTGVIRGVLRAFGEALDIDGTKLRPTDRFGKELALRGFPLDDTLESAIDEVARIVRTTSGDEWRPSKRTRTLHDLIEDVL